MYKAAIRPILFALPPGSAHAAAFAALAPFERSGALRVMLRAAIAPPDDDRIAVRLLGLKFPSPVGLAAGFDKNAARPRALGALGFGHLELGTVTALAQRANPSPNLFRLPSDRALVNRLGFPNQGAARVSARLAAARPALRVPVGMSIGKSRVVAVDDLRAVIDDYVTAFDCVRPVADFVVVNVSSPNTAGLRSLQSREHAQALLTTLVGRAGPAYPILVKIAPDLSDGALEDVLSVVDEVGIAGVVATNTTTGRAGLRTNPEEVRAMGAGGLSGAPLRPRAVAIIRRVRARLGRRAAVIGVGGVETADHALSLIVAGADLVQMYTGLIYEGPAAPARIARELARAVAREGVHNIAELVGRGGT